MSAFYIILLIGIVLVSLFLLLLVLMQRPKQEGLGATFGVDATNQMFGSRTTDVLQKGTTFTTVIFFLLAMGLGLLNAHESKRAARLGQNLAELERPAVSAPILPEATSPAVTIDPAVTEEGGVPPSLLDGGEAEAGDGLVVPEAGDGTAGDGTAGDGTAGDEAVGEPTGEGEVDEAEPVPAEPPTPN